MRQFHIALSLMASVLSCWLSTACVARAADDDPDSEVLRMAGIGTNDLALARFLRVPVDTPSSPTHIRELVGQLGSKHFHTRSQASKELIAIGKPALAELRTAQTSGDAEVRKRAKQCMEAIVGHYHKDSPLTRLADLPASAVRLIVRHRGPRAVAILLQFLPAAGPGAKTEIWFGVDTLTPKTGPADPVLVAALHDSEPARRALAACLLGARQDAAHRAAVRQLLRDSQAIVRLRAAQGLLAAHDKTAIPVLINLLTQAPVLLAWQAEELLHWAAADASPEAIIGSGAKEARLRCQAAWLAWWKARGSMLDLGRASLGYCRPGLVLVTCQNNDQASDSGIYVCGCDGRPRWQLKGLKPTTDAVLLSNGHILCGEGTLCERDLNGTVLWNWIAPDGLKGCEPLSNGKLFVLTTRDCLLLSPRHEVMYRHRSWSIQARDLGHCENGRVAYINPYGAHGGPVIHEWDPALEHENLVSPLNKELRNVDLRVDPLTNGHFLVYGGWAGKVLETDRAGNIHWQATAPFPESATRLHDGNTLVASLGRLLELNRQGQMVWEAFPTKGQLRIRSCLELVRVGFPPLPDAARGRVFWLARYLHGYPVYTRRQAAQQLDKLDRDARPALPALLKALADPDREVAGTVDDLLKSFGPSLKTELPTLLRFMDRPEQTCPVIRALYGIGPAAMPALRHMLQQDKRAYARGNAAWVLGIVGQETDDDLPELRQALHDPSPYVRQKAASALAVLARSTHPTTMALAAALQDRDPTVRMKTTWALSQLKDPSAIPALCQALQVQDRAFHAIVLRVLGAVGSNDPKVLKLLLQQLANGGADRGAVAAALGTFHTHANEVMPALVHCLKAHLDGQSRLSPQDLRGVIRALGEFGPAARPAVPLLVALTNQLNGPKDYPTVAQLAQTLGQIGPDAAAAVPMLMSALHDPKSKMPAQQATFCLGQIGTPAVPPLLDDLRHGNPERRMWAMDALSRMGPAAKPAVPVLLDLLTASNRPVERRSLEQQTIRILGMIGPAAAAAVPVLRDYVSHREPGASLAAEALGRIGAKDARTVTVLIDVLKDEQVPLDLRSSAAWALGHMGSNAKTVVPALVEALRIPPPPDDQAHMSQRSGRSSVNIYAEVSSVRPSLDLFREDLRGCALIALAELGPAARPATPALLRLCRDRQGELFDRWQAAVALGKIRPMNGRIIHTLIDVLQQDDTPFAVQLGAITGLGELNPLPPEARQTLQHLSRDGVWEVRRAAQVILKRRGR